MRDRNPHRFRSALTADSWADACALSRASALRGKAISKQTFAILPKGRKDRGSENSKIDLAKTYAMRRKMCVVSSMSVLSVSSGMAGEPIRRPWARCISINDDDRAQWIDNDEGGVVGIKAN